MNTIGSDEEIIPLDFPTRCEGNIEFWLSALEESMQMTL